MHRHLGSVVAVLLVLSAGAAPAADDPTVKVVEQQKMKAQENWEQLDAGEGAHVETFHRPMTSESRDQQDSPGASTGPFAQIDSLCESFSGDWKPAARPVFDDHLRQVESGKVAALNPHLVECPGKGRSAWALSGVGDAAHQP